MKKILIVEDDPVNRKLLGIILGKNGYDTVEAENGQVGIERAMVVLPDLIFMDIQMPVLDGWKATQALKENPATHHIPIVAITAFAMKEDRERLKNSGFDDFLTKPAVLERILEMAKKYTGE